MIFDWLQRHYAVLGLTISLLTMIGVYVGPRLAEKLRQRYERHREYRSRLRRFVIEPIQQRLEEYYLPMLRNEEPIVGIKPRLIPIEHARLGEVADTPGQFLSVIEPGDEKYAPTDADYYSAGVTSSGTQVPQTSQVAGAPSEFGKPEFLWRDARIQFPRFFRFWDEFSTAFRE
jgi:hypothetical protein